MEAQTKLAFVGAAATVLAATIPPIVSLLRPASTTPTLSSGPSVGSISQGPNGTVQVGQINNVNDKSLTNNSVVNNYVNAWVDGARTIIGTPPPPRSPEPARMHRPQEPGYTTQPAKPLTPNAPQVSPPPTQPRTGPGDSSQVAVPAQAASVAVLAQAASVAGRTIWSYVVAQCVLVCVSDDDCELQDKQGNLSTLRKGPQLEDNCNHYHLNKGVVEVLPTYPSTRNSVARVTEGSTLMQATVVHSTQELNPLTSYVSCPSRLPCGRVSASAANTTFASQGVGGERLARPMVNDLVRYVRMETRRPFPEGQWEWQQVISVVEPPTVGKFEVISASEERMMEVEVQTRRSHQSAEMARVGVLLKHELRWELQSILQKSAGR